MSPIRIKWVKIPVEKNQNCLALCLMGCYLGLLCSEFLTHPELGFSQLLMHFAMSLSQLQVIKQSLLHLDQVFKTDGQSLHVMRTLTSSQGSYSAIILYCEGGKVEEKTGMLSENSKEANERSGNTICTYDPNCSQLLSPSHSGPWEYPSLWSLEL